MTKIKLYNLIKKVCPLKEATDIINHCDQREYNKARLIVDNLQEELSDILNDTLDNVAFNMGLQKFDYYQVIWDALVHNLELETHGEC